MDPELARTLEELRSSVAELRQRVARLEGTPAQIVPVPESHAPGAPQGRTAALLGRSLMVLGGAYLLRAATDLGWLPPWLGAFTALIYAAVLLLLADRAALSASAVFHGGTALAIATPLVDEMLVRLHLVNAWGAAAIIAIFICATGLVAYRRRDAALAWLGVLAGAGAYAALAIQTQQLVPCLSGLTLMTGGAGVLVRRLDQRALLALPLTAGGLLAPWLAEVALGGDLALAAILAFFLVAVAAIWWSADTTHVEMVEAGLLAPAVLIEGARWAVDHTWFGAALLVAAAGAHGVARARGSRFFSTYWLLVALLALWVIAGGATLALLCLAVAAAMALARGDDFQVLAPLGAAAVASGLAGFTVRALALPEISPPSATALTVLAAMVAIAAARPRAAALLFASLGLAGLVAWAGITLLSASPVVMATLRTGVLGATVMALALLSRLPRAAAAARLVFPMLVIAGLKLLLEDFRVGTSAALFIDLALSGAVLIVAPRLRATAPNS